VPLSPVCPLCIRARMLLLLLLLMMMMMMMLMIASDAPSPAFLPCCMVIAAAA
jgi:hypothetical protein